MAAKIFFFGIVQQCLFMLIGEKTTGSIYLFIYFVLFFGSKGAYSIVRQLEKITVKKAQLKVVKCAKNKSCGPKTPLVS